MSDRNAERQPFLLVVDTSAENRFSSYIREILDVEGYLAREDLDLGAAPLTAQALADRDLVVVANVPLKTDAVKLLSDFVASGGNLVALRPPREMGALFGLKPSTGINKRVRDQYVELEREHPLATGVPAPTLQFNGEADIYLPAGADTLAWLSGEFGRKTGYPAVVTHQSPAGGKTAAFTYDLAASTVLFHQGRPENASDGPRADSDGDDRWIPNDLFVGHLDARLKYVPQADVHQDLLVRILNWMFGLPVPRLWYFPHGTPAIAYLNGDSDEMVLDDYLKVVDTVERFGGRYALYILQEHHALLDPELQRDLQRRGHALGHHIVLEWLTGIDEAKRQFDAEFESFRQRYGYTPLSNRGHCLIWPGWTKLAEWLAAIGVRMDQDFIPRRFYRHGYINGSALPVKFMTQEGTILDLYEQNTHITDDGSEFDEKFLVSGYTRQDVLDVAYAMLDDCVEKYHGVFQASFHPHLTVERVMWLLEAVVKRCWERNVPMIGADEWVRFNDARRAVRFEPLKWLADLKRLTFTIRSKAAIEGLPVLLPAQHDGAFLTAVRVNGEVAAPASRYFKSMRYALLDLDLPAGATANVEAQYEHRVTARANVPTSPKPVGAAR
jgi:hypothetical protein